MRPFLSSHPFFILLFPQNLYRSQKSRGLLYPVAVEGILVMGLFQGVDDLHHDLVFSWKKTSFRQIKTIGRADRLSDFLTIQPYDRRLIDFSQREHCLPGLCAIKMQAITDRSGKVRHFIRS